MQKSKWKLDKVMENQEETLEVKEKRSKEGKIKMNIKNDRKHEDQGKK